jgi:hypothetical protein
LTTPTIGVGTHQIRGLPHRIGARTTALTTAAILLIASAVDPVRSGRATRSLALGRLRRSGAADRCGRPPRPRRPVLAEVLPSDNPDRSARPGQLRVLGHPPLGRARNSASPKVIGSSGRDCADLALRLTGSLAADEDRRTLVPGVIPERPPSGHVWSLSCGLTKRPDCGTLTDAPTLWAGAVMVVSTGPT